MPTIVVLSNCKVQMFADDHVPPHFHLRGPNSNAMIRLGLFCVEPPITVIWRRPFPGLERTSLSSTQNGAV